MAPPIDLRRDTTAPRVEPDAAWLDSLPWKKTETASSKPVWLGARVDAQPAPSSESEVLEQDEPGAVEPDYNPEPAPAADVNNREPATVFETPRSSSPS